LVGGDEKFSVRNRASLSMERRVKQQKWVKDCSELGVKHITTDKKKQNRDTKSQPSQQKKKEKIQTQRLTQHREEKTARGPKKPTAES